MKEPAQHIRSTLLILISPTRWLDKTSFSFFVRQIASDIRTRDRVNLDMRWQFAKVEHCDGHAVLLSSAF